MNGLQQFAFGYVQFVVWQDQRGGLDEQIWGARVSLTGTVLDGELLVCEPAKSLPMTQRYFLF